MLELTVQNKVTTHYEGDKRLRLYGARCDNIKNMNIDEGNIRTLAHLWALGGLVHG